MGSFIQDCRYALRGLAKKPGFAIIAIATLALGVGVNTALFSVVKAVLLNSLPYRQPERLVTLAKSDADTPNPQNTSFGTTDDWKQRQRSFESIALDRGWGPAISGTATPQLLRGMRVTQNFFPTIGVEMALGRNFLPDEDTAKGSYVVLLGHSYWMQQFAGDPGVLGKSLILDEVPYRIVGVLPESFQSLSFSRSGKTPDVWAPLGYELSQPNACRTCEHLHSVARLKDGVSVAQARAEMQSIETQLAREFPKEYPPTATVVLKPLRDAWVGGVQAALWLLLGASGFVLLIACANIANLLLARAATKRREVAVRTALGASRWRVGRYLLSESLVLSFLGGSLGVALAVWGTALLVRWAPTGIPRLGDTRFDMPVLLFGLLVCVATGVLMGLVPAIQASRVDQREALQQQGSRGTVGLSRSRVRGLLVISEVALAFVLTVSSGLLLKSFVSALRVNPGFHTQNLSSMDFNLTGARYENDEKRTIQAEREVLARVRALPGVESVAMTDIFPGSGGTGNYDRRGFNVEDRAIPEAEVPSVDSFFVTPDYLNVMKIPVLRGRGFEEADGESGTPVALISESTAREMFPGEEPLGRRIQLGGRHPDRPWATIVGIVGDVRQYGQDSATTPQAYALYNFMTFTYPTLVVRSNIALQPLMTSVREQIWAVDKSIPISTPLMANEILAQSLEQRRFTMSLLAGFGALALLLAAVGIYGVMSYTVTQRTNEIGIRMALGAQARDIFAIVSRDGMLRAAIGLLVGLFVSMGLSRVLASQLFAVSPLDPATFAAGIALLAAVAFLACYVPARRATRVDPMAALHDE
jgi:putative ABC transport system permease protein